MISSLSSEGARSGMEVDIQVVFVEEFTRLALLAKATEPMLAY